MHAENSADAPPGSFVSTEGATLTPAQRRAGLAAIVLLALAGLWTVRGFLPALGWGTVLAVSVWPWYQRQCACWAGPRGLARRLVLPAAVSLAVALAFILPLVMVVSAIAHDSAGFTQWLDYVRTTGIPAPAMLAQLPMGGRIVAWWQNSIGQPGALGQLTRSPGAVLRFDEGGRVLSAVGRRVITIVFALLVLFFLLRDGERVATALRVGSRRAFGPAGEHVAGQIATAIRGTVNGLVVVGLGEGAILGLAYAVAGVPHPALFGLLTALLSVVPLGSVLAIIAAGGLLFAEGAIGGALGVIGLGAVVVFVADHFIRPVLIGEATRLPFLWVLLGILGGIEGWGLIGVVLGPALIAALMLLWREWIGAQPGPLNPPLVDAP